ncbi:MAG: glycosyltransferase family 2 protein [Candidatus Omnitrophota bacterium]
MNNTNIKVSVITPALNEEKNIRFTIDRILDVFERCNISGEIIVVNDGSTDRTEELVEDFIQSDSRVKVLKHETPQGMGASFWDGFDHAKGEIIVVIPGDNENDPWEILRYYSLLEHVDIVIPFIFNREVRPFLRNILSLLFRLIINSTFVVNFNYTNGTILYRKDIIQDVKYRSSSFFFQTDILIRLVKKGYLFAEVPFRLDIREQGRSKAVSFPSLLQVMKGYFRLIRDLYFAKESKIKVRFSQKSATAKRRQNNLIQQNRNQ